jgi:hypothetical protein
VRHAHRKWHQWKRHNRHYGHRDHYRWHSQHSHSRQGVHGRVRYRHADDWRVILKF